MIHITHHAVATFIAIRVIMFECTFDNGVWPKLESNWTYFKWIELAECRQRPYELEMLACIWSICYFIWDLARLLIFEPKLEILDK